MTDTTPTDAKRRAKQQKQSQYLQRLFSMHPMWQANQILELRRRALGLKPLLKSSEATLASTKLAKLRAHAKQQIARVQQEFWKVPLDQLKRNLETIPSDRLPEFLPVVTRLRTAAACRGQFPALTQSKSMDMRLFRAFKTAVVLPPAEAGYHREKFLQTIPDRKQLRAIKRAVNHIRTEHEALYELEKDWFETILKLKKPRATRPTVGEARSSFEWPEFGWGTWIAIVILIRVVMRLVMHNG